MKNYVIIGSIVVIIIIVSYFAYQNTQISQTNFSVFQDRKDNPKGSVVLNVNIPLDRESACLVAQKACNSNCVVALKKEELSRPLHFEEQAFGKFDWRVNLEPVCGDTVAYINEKAKTVVCFCAYE